jgi:hypothetical protein
LKDNDGDGAADEYETVFDDFGISGNYHEFAFGPAKDKQGNLYIALGVASNGAPMAKEVRGEFSAVGEVDRNGMSDLKLWEKNKGKAGRMYSRVIWRGWVLKLSPDGKKMEPYASGLRSPNGIGFDAKGRLLITDNQGDWRPTSPLYHIKKDGFYGHPASLVWRKDWDGRIPHNVLVSELNQLQQPAAGYFPQGELANSPTWPVILPEGAVPKGISGQTLIGEMNQPTMVRVLDDEVDGFFQTGLVKMFDESPLGNGSNRIAFGNDGSIYVGKIQLSWAGGKGITRIKWNGKPYAQLEKMKALPKGFELIFSQPIDPASLNYMVVKSHTYEYNSSYGAPKINERQLVINHSSISPDGLKLTLDIGPLKENYLHLIDMSAMHTKNGGIIYGNKVWYQVVKAPK